MPTNVKRTRRAMVAIDGFELCHLMLGDCLVGGGCGLCDQEGDEPTAPRILRLGYARDLWAHQRDDLLAQWGRWLDQRGEPGTFHPTFAQVLFDHAGMQEIASPDWPEVVKRRYFETVSNLRTLRAWMREHGLSL